jgi:hypothetical protein
MSATQLGRRAFLPAVFLGAFLLFQVQPLIGKAVLPWYGGTPAVWTTCLVVFQVLLFAGYAYVHGIQRLSVRSQTLAHLLLLVVAMLVPIVPGASWRPSGSEAPIPRILEMLGASVGLPYFALAATGPLLQAWYWRATGRAPYALYAVSNAGSLLALVSYPLIVEPWLGLGHQAQLWRGAFTLFVLLAAAAALATASATASRSARIPPGLGGESRVPSRWRLPLWLGWSACGVILFMAVTNQLTLSVAAGPFLWVLPLSIYLLTFILAFSGRSFYRRAAFGPLVVAAIVGLSIALQVEVRAASGGAFRLSLLQQLALYGAALFVLCLACHGELYRLRPEPARLTGFYVAVAGGGALGGLAVGVLAPLVFSLYQELHCGVLLCGALHLGTHWIESRGRPRRARPHLGLRLSGVGLAAVAALFVYQTYTLLYDARTTRRSFFGVLRVQEVGRSHPLARALRLWHGSTVHGYQFQSPELIDVPAGYYTPGTGVGAAFDLYRREGGRRIGVVGLGAGALAALGRSGDTLRFYEIDPAVIEIAKTDFSFLARSAAQCSIVLGDARASLEREGDQHFDILVLDAFTGDSLPVHLVTREAFATYVRHLSAEGLLAVHVSNRYLDLPRVIYPLADALGFRGLEIESPSSPARLTLATTWIILSHDPEFLLRLATRLEPLRVTGAVAVRPIRSEGVLWTDDRSSVLGILK